MRLEIRVLYLYLYPEIVDDLVVAARLCTHTFDTWFDNDKNVCLPFPAHAYLH